MATSTRGSGPSEHSRELRTLATTAGITSTARSTSAGGALPAQAEADGARAPARAARPWPPAHATAPPRRWSRPTRSTPRCRRGRGASAGLRCRRRRPQTLSTCGARSPSRPFTTRSGTAAHEPLGQRVPQGAARRSPRLPAPAPPAAAARPRATAPATFSVPGRRPNCWPPPWMIASTALRSRTTSAPMPLGAPILWPEIVSRVQGRSGNRDRQLAERLDGVGMEGHPGRLAPAGDLRAPAGSTPTSLLTHMTETTAGRSASAASSASRSSRPPASTGRITSRPPR